MRLTDVLGGVVALAVLRGLGVGRTVIPDIVARIEIGDWKARPEGLLGHVARPSGHGDVGKASRLSSLVVMRTSEHTRSNEVGRGKGGS